MEDQQFDGIETASPSVVMEAARSFAEALSETPQFTAFEQAAFAFRKDEAAQAAMQAFQQKQQSLRGLLMLNALDADQQAELDQLREAFLGHPVVQAYLQAQTELSVLCQALGGELSDATGINFSAACSVSCCG